MRFIIVSLFGEGVKEITVGLSENNPWKWCRISHGVTYEDFFWIRFEDEDIQWKDVRVRC